MSLIISVVSYYINSENFHELYKSKFIDGVALIRIFMVVIIFVFGQTVYLNADISQKKWRFGFYGGSQDAYSSRVNTYTDNGAELNFDAVWETKSFSMPPYWGIRSSYWDSPNTAWEIDFVHSKVYADSTTLTQNGLDHLQFTDGINVLSLSRIWQLVDPSSESVFSPYVGAGGGVTLPHVEIVKSSNPVISRTMEYQFGGFSGQVQVGLRYPLGSNINGILEYKITYVGLDVKTAASRSLKTNLITNALNIGVEF